MKKTYQGTCHCGSVTFSVQADLNHCFKCNCSFCVKRASTLVSVGESHFSLESADDQTQHYGSRSFAKHYFCKQCGIHCYTKFESDKGSGVNVNIGCLEGVDVLSLSPALFDGANKF